MAKIIGMNQNPYESPIETPSISKAPPSGPGFGILTISTVFGILFVSFVVASLFAFDPISGIAFLIACATIGILSFTWGVSVGVAKHPPN